MYRNRIADHIIIDSAELRRNPLNHRRHPDSQRHALRSLLGQVGIVDELLAYRDPEHGLTLVDGEARWSEGGSWPVAVLDLTPDEASTVMAMLDKIGADAEIDPDALMALLDSLPQEARQTAGQAWSDDELAAIIDGAVAGEPEPDEPVAIDETKPTRCQAGDVWRVGRHTVACVDSTDRATVEGLIAGRTVGMVVADPPYGMKLDTSYTSHTLSPAARSKHPTNRDHPPVIGDDQDFDPTSHLELFADVQEQFWWGADYYRKHLPDGGSWLVWDKRASVEDVEYSTASFELCWSKTQHRRDILRIPWFGIIGMEQEKGKRVHPTQKPIRIYEALYAIVAADLIFDPFLGSGPSLKAAEPSGRTVVGCELSPHYIDHLLEWGEARGLVVERAEH